MPQLLQCLPGLLIVLRPEVLPSLPLKSRNYRFLNLLTVLGRFYVFLMINNVYYDSLHHLQSRDQLLRSISPRKSRFSFKIPEGTLMQLTIGFSIQNGHRPKCSKISTVNEKIENLLPTDFGLHFYGFTYKFLGQSEQFGWSNDYRKVFA